MKDRFALVVEDSPTMRQLISLALRRVPGLSIIEAENGVQGLELLERYQVAVILLDLNMPVMSGFTFMERLSEWTERPAPPVVVITTEGGEEDAEQALRLGAAAYVTKPVQAASLAAVVKDVLERHPEPTEGD